MATAAALVLAFKLDTTSTGTDLLEYLRRIAPYVGGLNKAFPHLEVQYKFDDLTQWADAQSDARNLKNRIPKRTLSAVVFLRVSRVGQRRLTDTSPTCLCVQDALGEAAGRLSRITIPVSVSRYSDAGQHRASPVN